MPRQSGARTGGHFPNHAHFWVTLAQVQRDRRFLTASSCQCAGSPEHKGFPAQVPKGAAPQLPRTWALSRRSASAHLSQWPNINSSQFFCPTWPKNPSKKTHSTSHLAVHIYPHIWEGRDVLNHKYRCSCLSVRIQRSIPLSEGIIQNLVHHIKHPIQLEQRS